MQPTFLTLSRLLPEMVTRSTRTAALPRDHATVSGLAEIGVISKSMDAGVVVPESIIRSSRELKGTLALLAHSPAAAYLA